MTYTRYTFDESGLQMKLTEEERDTCEGVLRALGAGPMHLYVAKRVQLPADEWRDADGNVPHCISLQGGGMRVLVYYTGKHHWARVVFE